MKNIVFAIIIIAFQINTAVWSQSLISNPCTFPYPPGSEWIINGGCISASTSGMNALYNPSTCGSGNNDDGWAWFVGDGNIVTVSYNATNRDPILHVFSVITTPCSIAQVDCANNTGTNGTESVTFTSTLGTYYLVRIQASGTNSTMSGCLEVSSVPVIPGDYMQPTNYTNSEKVGACVVNDCGPFTFTDNGGTNGNYTNNIPGVYSPNNAIYRVFCPDAAGQCMQATFNEFNTANINDVLFVRNGPTEFSPNFTNPPIQTTAFTGAAAFTTGLYGNLNSSTPFSFTSTDASGCLTFAFISNSTNSASGWNATLQCIPCAGGPNGTDNNDCQNLTPLCSGTAVTSNSSGPGIVSEGCDGVNCPAGGENHSNWFKISIFTGGTFNITLTPATSTDDYDFSIYGPNVDCSNLGAPIRCSDAGTSGTTGLNNSAGDFTETVTGDGFLQTMNVNSGDTYIIVVDEWSSNSGSGYTMSFGGTAILDCNVLPVELSEFEASYVPHEDVIDLYWATESERDNDYFIVEKSIDGVHYEPINLVKGVGNSTMETKYYSIDNDPFVGVNYYRLKQVDTSGNSEYSEVRTVNILNDFYDMISIFPNPTLGISDVIFNSYNNSEAVLKVFNNLGEQIHEEIIKCVAGGNRFTLDLRNSSDGIYSVTISTNDKTYTSKLIKN